MSKIKSSIPTSLGQHRHVNLSSTQIGTTDFGRLDVLYHTPLNPGEDVNISLRGVLQSSPLVVNTFGKFRYDVRCFFVPNRILCHRPEEGPTNFVWDYFINKLSDVQHPWILLQQIVDSILSSIGANTPEGQDFRRLLSQLRYPDTVVNATTTDFTSLPILKMKVSPFPLMSYQRIWWDYYRNPQWIDESLLSTYIPYPSPAQNTSNTVYSWCKPRYSCFDKDYFTNSIPFGKYSNNEVASAVAVDSSEYQFNLRNTDKQDIINTDQGQTPIGGTYALQSQSSSGVPVAWIRSALAIDNYLSRLGIVGSRVTDRMKARFGIPSYYERKNVSSYLGGKSVDFTIGGNEVLTDTYDSTQQQGDFNNAYNLGGSEDGRLSGQRVGKLDQSLGFPNIKFHTEEYGTLMVIGTLIPDVGYYQGVNKDLRLGTSSAVNEQRFDYLTPELSNIGLQLIDTSEIYGDVFDGTSTLPFGWTERYGNYAYQPNVVDGDLILSTTKAGMDSFHLFRKFTGYPVNGNTFTTISPLERKQLDRIFQIANPADSTKTFDHFTRFTIVDCDVVRALSPSWLPELYEDNNHGNSTTIDVGGSRF